jgi:8-oxo-dGTP pyrophosphatase MutT (NUDIX family)
VEPGDTIEGRAYAEIYEETGLRPGQVHLIVKGPPIEFFDAQEDQHWCVHPFLFSTSTNEISIDWEHEAYMWITPDQLDTFETVPKLKETIRQMLTKHHFSS